MPIGRKLEAGAECRAARTSKEVESQVVILTRPASDPIIILAETVTFVKRKLNLVASDSDVDVLA